MTQQKRRPATTIRLEEQDKEAIARIKELYGCPADIAAIWLAPRIVAREVSTPPKPPNKDSLLSP